MSTSKATCRFRGNIDIFLKYRKYLGKKQLIKKLLKKIIFRYIIKWKMSI